MSSGFWQGVEAFEKALQQVSKLKDESGKVGILRALQNTLNVSNQQVPHEEGDLERDGAYSVDDAKLLGAISYGRRADTKDYAVPQHERMDYKHDGGRNAKFLENAFNSTRGENLEIIANAMREGMGTK